MPKRWPENKEKELTSLVKSGKYTYPEIAEIMGVNRNSIATKARALGLSNAVYMARKTKHAHLREAVLRYFLNHTWEQTRRRFNLTPSELKSIFTVAYRDPKFAHLRKDRRRRDAWTVKETLFMLQHAGIQERKWIAGKLKRGTKESVKEQLSRLNSNSKYMNGIPVAWAVRVAPELSNIGIKTKAGPTGGKRGSFRYKIIPWVQVAKLIKGKPLPADLRLGIEAMATFQRWIHGLKSDRAIIRRIESAARRA